MSIVHAPTHGLRTPNEGINQRNLKIWADVAGTKRVNIRGHFLVYFRGHFFKQGYIIIM